MSELDALLLDLTNTQKNLTKLNNQRLKNGRTSQEHAYSTFREAPADEKDYLYHYSDSGGLIGILGGVEKAIRLTDARYLNDASELLHIFDVAIDYLIHQKELLYRKNEPELAKEMEIEREILRIEYQKKLAHLTENYYQQAHKIEVEKSEHVLGHYYYSKPNSYKTYRRQILEQVIEKVQEARNNAPYDRACYVACFSENRDQLSQWRGYCPNGGYSIGLSAEKLAEIAGREDFVLTKCIYTKAEKFEHIEGVLQPYLKNAITIEVTKLELQWERDNLPEEQQDPEPGDTVGQYFEQYQGILDEFSRLAPIFKHEGFEEEAEWRLINKSALWGYGYAAEPKPVKYRSRGSLVVPYVELKLEDSVFEKGVFVTVGPMNGQEEAVSSTTAFLRSLGLDHGLVKYPFETTVKPSIIPFRTS